MFGDQVFFWLVGQCVSSSGKKFHHVNTWISCGFDEFVCLGIFIDMYSNKTQKIGGHGKGTCKIWQFSYWCQSYPSVFNWKYCTLSFIWILHVGLFSYFYHPRNPIKFNLCTLWGVLFAQGASGRNPHNSSPYPQRVRGISTARWKNARGNHAKSKASGRSWYAAASKRSNPEP